MECNGICYDDNAAYFQITCPGVYNNLPQKLKILKDGSSNKEYKDICQEQKNYANIAFNNWPGFFELDNDGSMVEYPVKPITGKSSNIPHEYEILSSFLENHHITPTWINCNYTFGNFDEETGHWTGAVGKVNK